MTVFPTVVSSPWGLVNTRLSQLSLKGLLQQSRRSARKGSEGCRLVIGTIRSLIPSRLRKNSIAGRVVCC